MLAFWVPWIWWRRPHGWEIAYNLPISFPFFVLGWEMLFARAHRAYWFVWGLAGAQTIARVLFWFPASGHLTWCVLMSAQVRWRRAPHWVVWSVVLVFVQSATHKLAFGGVAGGLAGVLCGSLLAWLLAALLAAETKKARANDT